MRANTAVHYKLESVGRPNHSTSGSGSIREVTLAIAQWLLVVPMGHKIRITIARTAEELLDRRSAANGELMDELESLLAGQEDSDGHSS